MKRLLVILFLLGPTTLLPAGPMTSPDGGVAKPAPYRASGPQVILERPTIFGSMPRDRAQKAIAKYRGAIQACYRKVLKDQPGLSGRIVATIAIGADGFVKATRFDKTEKKIPALQTCLLNEVPLMKFPSTSAGMTMIDQPFDFQPRPAGPTKR